ncbi:MAG TPA: right-handed parallel beta-helix repeat-containing protein, partial [Candidatus Eisenbacteria bacterium]|nr:right-handed parallel beta-helix repeat-containing protein [Candidatus Eisenbacteria bacterium]
YRGPFTMKKPLLLFADAGPESTFLDGGDSVRVLHVEGVRGGGVVGFGIRGGKAVAGGGIYALRDSAFTVDFCHFTKNWESGLAVWESGDFKLANSRFTENLGSAVQFHQTNGFILSCEFYRNKGDGGGGVNFDRSEFLVFRQCRFEDNRAETTVGGAVLIDSTRTTITNCDFIRNTSAVAGGAVAVVNRGFLTMSRNVFTENRAAQAGALHGDASQMLIGFSIFDRNHATAGGGAVGVLGRIDANINQTFSSNTFYKNATDGSGATFFSVKTSPELIKNIFVVEGKEQLATAGVESAPRYECNLIHDPSGVALGRLPSKDTLVGDPLFCDPAHGNFDLRTLSPALRSTCGQVGARPRGCDTFKLQPSR